MKYNCDMIRDLMPLCADGIASDSSKQAVETHIQTCTECAREWSEITSDMSVPETESVPAEIRFAQAAKRYRKKRLLRILCAVGAVLLLLFVFSSSPLSYGHLTAKGALRSSIRHSSPISDFFAFSNYEIIMEKRWDSSEKTLEESDTDVIYWLREKNNPVCIREMAYGRHQWNLYHESMGGVFPYDKSVPVALLDVIVCPAYNGATLVPALVNDEAVKTVRVTINGETQTAQPNQYGMCLMQFQFDTMLYIGMEDGEWRGEALDANGNVLYRMQPADKSKNVYPPYEWVKES